MANTVDLKKPELFVVIGKSEKFYPYSDVNDLRIVERQDWRTGSLVMLLNTSVGKLAWVNSEFIENAQKLSFLKKLC